MKLPYAAAALMIGLLLGFGPPLTSPAFAQGSMKPVPAAGTAPESAKGANANLMAEVENFDSSKWTAEGLTVSRAPTAPPGAQKAAFFLDETGTTGRHRIWVTVPGVTPGAVGTLSLYVKPVNRQYLEFEIRDHTPGKYGLVRFDFGKRQLDVKTGDIVSAGLEPLPDGWFHCWAVTPFATDTAVFSFALTDDQGARSYGGNEKSGVVVSAVQFERGDNPQAYKSGGG